MAAFGFAQAAEAEATPEARAVAVERLERALDRALGLEGRRFDLDRWGEDPLAEGAAGDHAAWLGYVALALGRHRALVPDGRFAVLHDRLSDALEARADAAATADRLLETYPGECYPVDNAAVHAAIALRRTLAGRPPASSSAAFERLVRTRLLDHGLLVQAASRDVRARGPGRGSGTMLASWFLRTSHPALARDLYDAARAELYGEVLGFGALREYRGAEPGPGDIDSGPLLLGLSVSATGFAIGAARARGDAATSAALRRTSLLFGAPGTGPGDAVRYATGGPLGDALLFAMATTPEGR